MFIFDMNGTPYMEWQW